MVGGPCGLRPKACAVARGILKTAVPHHLGFQSVIIMVGSACERDAHELAGYALRFRRVDCQCSFHVSAQVGKTPRIVAHAL